MWLTYWQSGMYDYVAIVSLPFAIIIHVYSIRLLLLLY